MPFLFGESIGRSPTSTTSHNATGRSPRRSPVSSLESPPRGSRSLAPAARSCAQRVRGRRRWANLFAFADKQTTISIPFNQGVGRPGHGSPGNWSDPAGRKNGCESHRRGAGNRATPATHAGRQAGREAGIGITCEVARRCRSTMAVNRVAPGSSVGRRERKRVTAPSHGAVWSLSSRLG